MLQAKKNWYDKAGPRVAENLGRRQFEAYYCATAQEAAEKVLSDIAENREKYASDLAALAGQLEEAAHENEKQFLKLLES